MTMNWLLNDLIDTAITVVTTDKAGEVVDEKHFKNTLTKEGATVLSRLLIDPAASRPSHIYARFAGNKTDADLSTNFSSDITHQDVTYSDFTVSANAGIGCLRAALFTTVKIEDNGDIADGTVTLYFKLTPDSVLNSNYVFNTSSSQVFYLGLAASRDQSDPSQDLIFSVLTSYDEESFQGFTIPDGGQVTIDYKLTTGA